MEGRDQLQRLVSGHSPGRGASGMRGGLGLALKCGSEDVIIPQNERDSQHWEEQERREYRGEVKKVLSRGRPEGGEWEERVERARGKSRAEPSDGRQAGSGRLAGTPLG